MKKMLAAFMATALIVGSLVGCGSSTKKETTAATAASGETTAESTAAVEGGTLKLSVTTGDGSTSDDKIPTPWYNRIMATNLMFRALFIADSDLTNPQPDLAESVEISEDSLVYTITMKEGLKWSDGEALTAEDVKWSIETALKAATVNSIYTSAFKNISDIAVDGNKITLTLSTQYAAIHDVLAHKYILPKQSQENDYQLKK